MSLNKIKNYFEPKSILDIGWFGLTQNQKDGVIELLVN